MQMKRIRLILSAAIFLFSITAHAEVRLPGIFSSNMVLQRDQPVKIWGWATNGQQVTVNFHGQEASAKADAKGLWSVTLKPMPFGGPFELKVQEGQDQITLDNILMGDVWVCSGQSNMEFPVKGWASVDSAEQVIRHAKHPNIRLFTVEKNISTTPQSEVKGGTWQLCNPQNIPPFSAVGYLFGRDLEAALHIPIGLINSTWGGTDIETWISRQSLEASPEYGDVVKKLPAVNIDSLQNKQKNNAAKRLQDIQGGLPDPAEVPAFRKMNFDASKWPQMNLPDFWEGGALDRNFDGVVWFRREIDVNAADAEQGATLYLAKIDDNDSTFINGEYIGSTNNASANRKYQVKAGLLKAGKNVIAVRVDDTGGNGGIYGAEEDLKLVIGDKTIALKGSWHFLATELAAQVGQFGPNNYPSLLYNAMIQPITGLGVKGVIWYQGENNAVRGYQYRYGLPLLIKDWRKQFDNAKMPFYFVQIAGFDAAGGNSNKGSTWAELRESQTKTLSVPYTGMAVTIDIGNAKNIHPTNKQDVASRLAALALKNDYGKSIVAAGPMYTSMKVQGSNVALNFSDIGSGLTIGNNGDGTELKGMEIAGADQKFYPAQATIQGDQLIVSSDQVKKPVAVRYAWSDDTDGDNLFNKEGFPAVPFRTDNWPAITKDIKYNIQL